MYTVSFVQVYVSDNYKLSKYWQSLLDEDLMSPPPHLNFWMFSSFDNDNDNTLFDYNIHIYTTNLQ